jgi:hypothetical protein
VFVEVITRDVTSAGLAAALLLIGCLMPRHVTEPETKAV